MEFLLGCNYWASNAGTDMWVNFSPEHIERDLKVLSSHGVSYIRVFPNWRDFQPVVAMYGLRGETVEYRMRCGDLPSDSCYLDEKMMARFAEFCDICDKYNIRLIVGLLTGWMSGRLFIPEALNNKNLFTDPTAQVFEQKFIKGFVSAFKARDTIYAWDLGNECNCMWQAESHMEAYSWSMMISNAIKASDPTRPVISGLCGLGFDSALWRIREHGDATDILTTHPYPIFVAHANKTGIGTLRTTLHATCETKLYSDISGKPALVEEIGTLGPMVCSDELAGDFLRCNLFSNYFNGAVGVLWWCANDQTCLTNPPYAWQMCEVELGMLTSSGNPKPVLLEMKKFSEAMSSLGIRPAKPKPDAICILTKKQDQWGVAYMTYCLAKEAGIDIDFAYCEDDIPYSDVYMLPSVDFINREDFDKLRRRVKDGATLYISNNQAFISELSDFAGIRVLDSAYSGEVRALDFEGERFLLTSSRYFNIESCGAKVILSDTEGRPAMLENSFGSGKVIYLNFPLEKMILADATALDTGIYKLYQKCFAEIIGAKTVTTANPYVALGEYQDGDRRFIVAINHSTSPQNPMLTFKKAKAKEVLYGNPDAIPAFDALIITIE